MASMVLHYQSQRSFQKENTLALVVLHFLEIIKLKPNKGRVIMKIEKIIGTVPADSTKKIDYVSIDWYNACKKIQRLTSSEGVDVGLALDTESQSRGLRQDDILAETEDTILAINILPCEVLLISGENKALLPKICYEIGNRHAPFFYADNHSDFMTPFDKPIQVMLEKLGANVEVVTRRINLSHNISSSHGGGHSHSH